MPSVKQVLNKVADRLDAGWCQGYIARDAEGKATDLWLKEGEKAPVAFCVWGAINAEAGVGPDRSQLVLDCRSAIGKVIGTENLAIWNDEPGRTKGEVVTAVRSAAEVLP